MPELPEVEVVRRQLQSFVEKPASIGVTLQKIEFFRRDLRDPIPVAKLKKLEGSRLISVQRRAKYLIIETSGGSILSHLGMTGVWRCSDRTDPLISHDHVRMHFSNGETWTFHDPRRFGIMDILDEKVLAKRLAHLGPEPLSEDFNGAVLWQRLRNRNTAIKVAIMDQQVVVGVGNIYASEALFQAGIRPSVKAFKLSRPRANNLVAAIKKVLAEAIVAGGSTISDFASVNGESGYFQDSHQVYDRAGSPCRLCATPLRHTVTAGRSTYWCPHCQK